MKHIKEHHEWMEEYIKCKESPYYFATTYLTIIDKDGKITPYTTNYTEEEFNKMFKYHNE